jgi:hypothetical protein
MSSNQGLLMRDISPFLSWTEFEYSLENNSFIVYSHPQMISKDGIRIWNHLSCPDKTITVF